MVVCNAKVKEYKPIQLPLPPLGGYICSLKLVGLEFVVCLSVVNNSLSLALIQKAPSFKEILKIALKVCKMLWFLNQLKGVLAQS